MQKNIVPSALRRTQFISLRVKLLVGFTIVYSVVFAMTYGWFYRYSTDKALERIQNDLKHTLEGTIAGINADEFQSLAVVNVPTGQIWPVDHPLYQKHQAWLQMVHQLEPYANPYTFIAGSRPYETLWIGDYLRISQPQSSTSFREPYFADPAKTRLYQGLTRVAITMTPYQDKWGSWVSAYGPIKNEQGKVVGGVGVDFRADHVLEVQQEIRRHFAIAFTITYLSLFLLVYVIAEFVTRPVAQLVAATEQISDGGYDQALAPLRSRRFQDEMTALADTFERMVEKIRQREALLHEYNHSLEAKVAQRTEELQAKNAQLAQTNVDLARATRLKDEFLANMSHELRTPLNAILGLTEGLQDQIFGPTSEKQLKALKTIERSGVHLLALISNILDIATIESGQLTLNCGLVAVAPLCQSSVAFIHQQALVKTIQLDVELLPNLPNLYGDERRLYQVLISLLSNAVKFTPNGGQVTLKVIYPYLRANALAAHPLLRIAVTDTGIGIAPEDVPRLFQPFIQVDAALNRQYEGTGLGLALVKRLVELHGGHVGVTSELAVGSCFTVDLPCAGATFSEVAAELNPAVETGSTRLR